VFLENAKQLNLGFCGESPISSRKIVPPLASSNRPNRWAMASAEGALFMANSSLSTRPSGSAAQLTLMSGLSLRLLIGVDCAGDQLFAGARFAGDKN